MYKITKRQNYAYLSDTETIGRLFSRNIAYLNSEAKGYLVQLILKFLLLILIITVFYIFLFHHNIAHAGQCSETCGSAPVPCAVYTCPSWISCPGNICNWCCTVGAGTQCPCGGGCNPNNWGGWSACSASCGGGTQCRTNECGTSQCQACNTQPCCTAISPNIPTLASPANGSYISTNSPTLIWNDLSNWGKGCPTTFKYYRLYLKPCSASSWTYDSGLLNNITNQQIQNLEWSTEYCWQVQASNGSLLTSSETWRFTPKISPYIATYGGDTYIQTGLPFSSLSAPKSSEITVDMTNPNARISKIRNELGLLPYVAMSSNLFGSATITNAQDRASRNLASISLYEKSYTNYTLPFTGKQNQQYAQSLYAYYKNKFNNSNFSTTMFVKKNITKNTIYKNQPLDLRDAFGLSENADKLIVDLVNQTADNNFTIYSDGFTVGNNNIVANPQAGFIYDQSSVYELRNAGQDDWAQMRVSKPGYTPREAINCYRNTIFLVPGNLTISTDIINTNPNSSCVFIVEGHLTIKLPDKFVNPANANTYNKNYRRVDALFLANSMTVRGKDDQGAIIINGAVITHDSVDNKTLLNSPDYYGENKFDIMTKNQLRPQTLIIYDPRYIILWADELDGNLNNIQIREERYLQFVK